MLLEDVLLGSKPSHQAGLEPHHLHSEQRCYVLPHRRCLTSITSSSPFFFIFHFLGFKIVRERVSRRGGGGADDNHLDPGRFTDPGYELAMQCGCSSSCCSVDHRFAIAVTSTAFSNPFNNFPTNLMARMTQLEEGPTIACTR